MDSEEVGVAHRSRTRKTIATAPKVPWSWVPSHSETDDRGFKLAVELDVTLPQVQDLEHAISLVAAAHQVCPYSNATRGNVDVALTVNGTPRSYPSPAGAQIIAEPAIVQEHEAAPHALIRRATSRKWNKRARGDVLRLPAKEARDEGPQLPQIAEAQAGRKGRQATR